MEPILESQMNALKDSTVAVIGYGSQGRGQALNLKDSGIDVVVGLREGSASRAPTLPTSFRWAAPGWACRPS